MPPRRFSRHTFTIGRADAQGRLYLSDRKRFLYRSLPDNIEHTVKQGDTLWTLAGRYFASLPRPAGLWWVIMDFQPDPIHDPTLELVPGTVLHIPSERTILEEIFSEKRRAEPAL